MNVTEPEEITIEDDDGNTIIRNSSVAMIVDELLIYEENGDTDYYPSVEDMIGNED